MSVSHNTIALGIIYAVAFSDRRYSTENMFAHHIFLVRAVNTVYIQLDEMIKNPLKQMLKKSLQLSMFIMKKHGKLLL